jgi:2-isopropylmalate synthase
MSLSVEERLRLVHKLDELGIGHIEAGFPSSNPKDVELFELLAAKPTAHAQVVAFGMTRRRGVEAHDDPGLQALASCFAPVCTLVGKTWALHLEKVVRVDREENLRMIADSVAFLVAEGKRVIYDAEHFFDGWRDDGDYALACLQAAAGAGAETVVLCDTNGGSLPARIGEATAAAAGAVAGPRIGIHCHNDADCAVANTLEAVQRGATHVQGTLNGYGERCGNANLVSIIPNLQLKLGLRCLTDEQLAMLTEVSHFADELLNFNPDPDQPYVGRNAFAHKGGMHVAGVNADPATFEHTDPALVGNRRELLVSELAGRGTIEARAREAGFELDPDAARRVTDRVKELEHDGYHFEAADGSFELLLRRETGSYQRLFTLESWRVIVDKRGSEPAQCDATVKVRVHGERRAVHHGEGHGPVNALDQALRKAISELHPDIGEIHLVDYKVRIVDGREGTAAVTRVLLDSSDGEHVWGSIGVSENIIEASWEALVESLEYKLQPEVASRDAALAEATPK